MKCSNETPCSGEVNLESPVSLRVGCSAFNPGYPCGTCGRLHWGNGNPVVSRQGFRAFLEGENVVVQRDEEGKEHHRLMAGM